LGLDAQRRQIREFVQGRGEVVGWYEDHESGAKADREGLEQALGLCEITGSTLIVATLSRLSRDPLALELIKRRCEVGGFEFKCADMPDANAFTLGVFGQLVAYERQRIRETTRAALQAAKRRGVLLGAASPDHPGAALFDGKREAGARRAGERARERADEWAAKRRGVVAELVAQGLSNREIARELTCRRIAAPRGGAWTHVGVARLRRRLGLDGACPRVA
jgi:DNA invertase Pin-like site-specific DNA recombinase